MKAQIVRSIQLYTKQQVEEIVSRIINQKNMHDIYAEAEKVESELKMDFSEQERFEVPY